MKRDKRKMDEISIGIALNNFAFLYRIKMLSMRADLENCIVYI